MALLSVLTITIIKRVKIKYCNAKPTLFIKSLYVFTTVVKFGTRIMLQ